MKDIKAFYKTVGTCALLGSLGIGAYIYYRQHTNIKCEDEDDLETKLFKQLEIQIQQLENKNPKDANTDNNVKAVHLDSSSFYLLPKPNEENDQVIINGDDEFFFDLETPRFATPDKASSSGMFSDGENSINTFPRVNKRRHNKEEGQYFNSIENSHSFFSNEDQLNTSSIPFPSHNSFDKNVSHTLNTSINIDQQKATKITDIIVTALEESDFSPLIPHDLLPFVNETGHFSLLTVNFSTLKTSLKKLARTNDDIDFDKLSAQLEVLERVLEPRINLLVRTLNSLANMSAFTENQDLFRNLGCLNHLMRILANSTNEKILTASAQCIANLALNEENHKILKECTSLLLKLIINDYMHSHRRPTGPQEQNGYHTPKYIKLNSRFCVTALTALINLTVLEPCIEAFTTGIPFESDGFFSNQMNKATLHTTSSHPVSALFELVNLEKNYEIKLNVLNLLVNLSCYDALCFEICCAKVGNDIVFLFESYIDAQLLLRSTTLLEHTFKLHLALAQEPSRWFGEIPKLESLIANLPSTLVNSNASPGKKDSYHNLICALYGSNSFLAVCSSNAKFFKGRLSQLKCHRMPEIRDNASKVFGYLTTLMTSSTLNFT